MENEQKFSPESENPPEVIVRGPEIVQDKETYTLLYGDKSLTLTLIEHTPGAIRAISFIKNTGHEENRVLNQTTTIYERASELMQKMADERGLEVHYRFGTRFPKMARWAKTKGMEIFEWDNPNSQDPNSLEPGDRYEERKIFYPTKRAQE